MPRPASDKKTKLVAAAIDCFHRYGYARTSLTDVAKQAGIAPGSVFYHFRTKDDLARAVVDAWCGQLTVYAEAFSPGKDSWAKLIAFVEQAEMLAQMYVTLGCPLGGLSRDLRREGSALATQAPRIYAVQQAWLRARFDEIGFPLAEAETYTRFLMASFHGAVMLAHVNDDDSLIRSAVTSLTEWLARLRAGHDVRVSA